MRIGSGTGDFKAWIDWQNSQLASVTGEAQIQQVKLARKDKGMFPVERLKTRFQWQAKDLRWRLDVRDFELETADAAKKTIKQWPAADFSVSGDFTEDRWPRKMAVFVRQLDLEEAAGLVRFLAPLSDRQSKMLAQARLNGLIENVSVFADWEDERFAVNGRFTGVGMNIISPPSDAITVLNTGMQFGAGAEYELLKGIVIGADGRYHHTFDDVDGVDTDGFTLGGSVGFRF